MRYFAIGVLAFMLAACPAQNNQPGVDGSTSHPDSTTHPDGSTIHGDAAGGDAAKLVCTGQVYDACNPAANNCKAATTCKTFNGSMFSVCSPACSAQTPCPMQNGQAVTCNNMGVCKPSAPNSTCMAP